MNQHRTKRVGVWGFSLSLIGLVLSIFGLVVANTLNTTQAEDNKPAVQSKPVSLVGRWHQTSGMPGTSMKAEISGDNIQIWLTVGDSHGIFWMGSFDTSDKKTQTFTVTSLPDPDAKKVLKGSLFGDSAESSKKFTYKNGDLSYEFSMMNVESTVHLTKGN